jgi:hypothetical protein
VGAYDSPAYKRRIALRKRREEAAWVSKAGSVAVRFVEPRPKDRG